MVLGCYIAGILYSSLWSHSVCRGWLADMDRIPSERMKRMSVKKVLGDSTRDGNRFPVAIDGFKAA